MIAPMQAHTPHILILAAGASRRMAPRDKLLEVIDGQPLLARITTRALATGQPVSVTLPHDNPARNAALAGLGVQIIPVNTPALGMAASLRAGITALPDAPILLVLADLPEITSADLTHMLDRWRETPNLILRATSAAGTPGHPIGFPLWARPELLEIQGDIGARAVLHAHPDKIKLIALPDQHATTDLDTPEDWANWRAMRPIAPAPHGP